MNSTTITSHSDLPGIVKDLWSRNEAMLNRYIDLLQWWNTRINLLSRDVSRETIEFHVRHSLNILPFIQTGRRVVDMGTGGGLPGLVLAIVDPAGRYVLNDIQQKKCMAVRQMILDLGLHDAEVMAGDVKALAMDEKIQWVSKHAFKMDQLLPELGANDWEQAVMLKGMDDILLETQGVPQAEYQHEIINLQDVWNDVRYEGKGLWIIRSRNSR